MDNTEFQNKTKMPEAEVSLRLAFFLISNGLTSQSVEISIDGAQVKTDEKIHFQIENFLKIEGWHKTAPIGSWQGEYINPIFQQKICIHSMPGKGDVVAHLKSGKRLRVESKKGPLINSKSSQEYPLLREALGQILTVNEISDNDLLAVAVPSSRKFDSLAVQWRKSPLIKKIGILILTVESSGNVNGF